MNYDKWRYDDRDELLLGRYNFDALEHLDSDMGKVKEALARILVHLGLEDEYFDGESL